MKLALTRRDKITLAIFFGVICIGILLVYFPVSPHGIWTGRSILCMCPCHNFILVETGRAAICSENHSTWLKFDPVSRVDSRTWRWLRVEAVPDEIEGTTVEAIVTNSTLFRATPLFLRVKFNDSEEWETLHRDFRWIHAKRIMSSLKGPITGQMQSEASAAVFNQVWADREKWKSVPWSKIMSLVDDEITRLLSNRPPTSVGEK